MKELLRKAFEAGQQYQIALYNDYHKNECNKKQPFDEWYAENIDNIGKSTNLIEMETLYRKIFMEGKEENLPKKAGNYFIGHKKPNRFDSCSYGTIHYNTSSGDEKYWMKKVDWYLQPVEIPSEEELDDKANFYYVKGCDLHLTTRDAYIDGMKQVINKLTSK
jgi:hypothetical protein